MECVWRYVKPEVKMILILGGQSQLVSCVLSLLPPFPSLEAERIESGAQNSRVRNKFDASSRE